MPASTWFSALSLTQISSRLLPVSFAHWYKKLNIRLSGPALGRPRKVTAENAAALKAQKKLAVQDELERIPVEGKIVNAKRKGTLARIMAKLSRPSESVINIGLIVLNLDTWLRAILLALALALALEFKALAS